MKKLASEDIITQISDNDHFLVTQNGKVRRYPANNMNYNADDYWYGFRLTVGQTGTTVTAIGKTELLSSKPVHANIYPAVIAEDGSIAYELDRLDIRKKLNGTNADLTGADGDVMTVIPEYYWKKEITTDETNTYIDFKFSPSPLSGFTKIPKHARGIYQGYIDGTTGKLRSISGVTPTTNKTRDQFRQAAKAKTAHSGWCQNIYYIYEADYFLWVAESLNLNSQESIGAGANNANGIDWSEYNGYYPVWKTDEGNDTLIRTGQIPVTVPNFKGNAVTDETFTSNFDTAVSLAHSPLRNGSVTVTTTDGATTYTEGDDYTIDYDNGTITVLSTGSMSDATNYYIDYIYLTDLSTNIAVLWWMRDIFGHIYEFMDGINVNNNGSHSIAYKCENVANLADDTDTNYEEIGNLCEVDGYISKFMPQTILPLEVGGSSSAHCGDYYYTYFDNNPSSGWRVALWGGGLHNGSYVGLVYSYFYLSSSNAYSFVGGRLCLIWDE